MFRKLIVGLGVEFGPILLFFVLSEYMSFIKATSFFVAATTISLVVAYFEQRRIAWFPLIVGVSVIVFGAATIIFNAPFFLIIKDTLYNGVFAVVLFIGLFYDRGLLKPLFDKLFAMTDRGWKILSLRWAIMFTLLAITNEIARIHLPPEKWVIYKALATIATIAFSLYQFRLAKKERLPESSPWGMRILSNK